MDQTSRNRYGLRRLPAGALIEKAKLRSCFDAAPAPGKLEHDVFVTLSPQARREDRRSRRLAAPAGEPGAVAPPPGPAQGEIARQAIPLEQAERPESFFSRARLAIPLGEAEHPEGFSSARPARLLEEEEEHTAMSKVAGVPPACARQREPSDSRPDPPSRSLSFTSEASTVTRQLSGASAEPRVFDVRVFGDGEGEYDGDDDEELEEKKT